MQPYIHPLAVRSYLGILDAACLSQIILDAKTKQRAFASLAVLRKYERWRKSENVVMMAFVGAIKQLFTMDPRRCVGLLISGWV